MECGRIQEFPVEPQPTTLHGVVHTSETENTEWQ